MERGESNVLQTAFDARRFDSWMCRGITAWRTRAHHLLSGLVLQMVGTLSLCPPCGRWTKRQSERAL